MGTNSTSSEDGSDSGEEASSEANTKGSTLDRIITKIFLFIENLQYSNCTQLSAVGFINHAEEQF